MQSAIHIRERLHDSAFQDGTIIGLGNCASTPPLPNANVVFILVKSAAQNNDNCCYPAARSLGSNLYDSHRVRAQINCEILRVLKLPALWRDRIRVL